MATRPVDGEETLCSASQCEPHLVMLGNSMQGCGIDFPALSQALGLRVESRASGGIMSAHKFALLWHEAMEENRPRLAIIVFRRDYIVRPTARVTDKYWEKLDEILTHGDLRKIVEDVAHPMVPPGEQTFPERVAASFLPHMSRVAKEAGIELVLARCKSRAYAEDPAYETAAMREFDNDLTAYLQDQCIHFLDYVHEPSVRLEHYGNGDHLNGAGKQAWTPLVAADLEAILAGRQAPRERTLLSSANAVSPGSP
jgi:hypothetical protein